MPTSSKRGAAARQLRVLEELRPVLRASVTPERMLRSVAGVLAMSGGYCIVDAVDAHGHISRLEIAHADASRREKLRVAAEDTRHTQDGRVARLLLATGSTELVGSVSRAVASERLGDIVLLHGQRLRSYMAAVVTANGAPTAVLTIVSTHAGRKLTARDLAFLAVVADWTGLGLENALAREHQPRASVAPPSGLRGEEGSATAHVGATRTVAPR